MKMTVARTESSSVASSSDGAALQKYAVIVAGGSGLRAGGGVPKQFRNLGGRPVVWWAMKAFRDADPSTRIILVVRKDCLPLWEALFEALPSADRIEHEIAFGGATRGDSVLSALAMIESRDDVLVAIHDGARPLVDVQMVSRGWLEGAASGACVPCLPCSDSLRRITPGGTEAVSRKDYLAVQTPQIFRADIIKDAYSCSEGEFTDDASVAESAGNRVSVYEGSPENIKVTNPGDFAIARALLALRGFDKE